MIHSSYNTPNHTRAIICTATLLLVGRPILADELAKISSLWGLILARVDLFL